MLELYQREESEDCKKVRQKLTDLELDFVAKIVSEEKEKRIMLKLISGSEEIPVLVDNLRKKVILNAEKINEYLEINYS